MRGPKQRQARHELGNRRRSASPAAGIAGDQDGPLFLTTGRKTGELHRMTQPDAYRIIRRRARGGRDQNQGRQSQPARHRHHRLPEKRRDAGTRAGNGEPLLAAHDQAV